MPVNIGVIEGIIRLRDEFSSTLELHANRLDKAGSKMKAFGESLSNVGSRMTQSITLPIVAIGVGVTKLASDFESSFAGVRKTVDATEEEFTQLSQGMRNMARELPLSVNNLNAVAEAAGQLGIKKEDILQFIRVMADLGETTNLTAEEAATATAQFQNIFGAAGKEVDRLGSTIVALGNAGASTEKDIIEMGVRIAGAGVQIGLTQGEVLALASTLSSLGIEAEAGGSAISKVMIDMALAVSHGGEELQAFADVAGLTSQELASLFNTDAASALNEFITGLGRMKDAGQNVLGTLEDMGIKEVRMRDALLRSSSAGTLLTDQLKLQATAWKENSALTKEAGERYKTFESQLKIFLNQLKDVGITIGTALLPILRDLLTSLKPLIDRLADLAQWFSGLPRGVQVFILALAGIIAAIGPVIFVVGNLITSFGAILTLAPKIAAAVQLMTGPWGALAAAISLATFYLLDYINQWKQYHSAGIAEINKDAQRIKALHDALAALRNDAARGIGPADPSKMGFISPQQMSALKSAFASVRAEIESTRKKIDQIRSRPVTFAESLGISSRTGELDKLQGDLHRLGREYSLIEGALKEVKVQAEKTSDAIVNTPPKVPPMLKATGEEIANLKDEFKSLFDGLKTGREQTLDSIKRLNELFKAGIVPIDQYRIAYGRLVDQLVRGGGDLETVDFTVTASQGNIADLQGFANANIAAIDRYIAGLERARSITTDMATVEERKAKAVAEARRLYEEFVRTGGKAGISAETLRRVLKANADVIKDMQKGMKDFAKQTEKVVDTLGSIGSSLSQIGSALNNESLQQWGAAFGAAGSAVSASQQYSSTGTLSSGITAATSWLTLFVDIANLLTKKGGKFIIALNEAGELTSGRSGWADMDPAMYQLVGQFEDMIDQVVDSIGALSGVLGATQLRITSGGDALATDIYGSVINFGSDVAAAMEFAIITAVRSGDFIGLSEEAQQAIENSTATNLQDFLADVDLATHISDLSSGAPELTAQLRELGQQFLRTAADAERLGLSTGGLLTEFGSNLQDIYDRLTGVTRSPMEQAQRDADAFNRFIEQFTRAQEQLMALRAAEMESEIARLMAEYQLTREQILANQIGVEILRQAGTEISEAIARIAALQAEIDRYRETIATLPPTIQPGQVRPQGGTGGGRRQQRASLEDELRSILRDAMPDLARSLADARDRIRELEAEIARLGPDATLAAAALAELRRELGEEIRDMVNEALTGGSDTWQAQAADIRDRWQEVTDAVRQHLEETGERLVPFWQINAAMAAELASLAEDAIASLGLPLETVRADMAQLGQTIDFLRQMVEDGIISADRYAEVIAQLGDQMFSQIGNDILAFIDQWGLEIEGVSELRRTLTELDIRMQILSWETQIALAEEMGILTAAQSDLLNGMIDQIESQLPDLLDDIAEGVDDIADSVGEMSSSITSWFNASQQQAQEANDNLIRAQELLDQYRDAGMSPFLRDLERLEEDFDLIREVLGNTAEVQELYADALERLHDQYLDSVRDFQESYILGEDSPLSIQERFAEAQRQFNEILAQAQGGDLSNAGQLSGLADTILSLFSEIVPSGSQAYRDFFDTIMAQLSELTGVIVPPTATPANLNNVIQFPGNLVSTTADTSSVTRAIEDTSNVQVLELTRIRRATQRVSEEIYLLRQASRQPSPLREAS